MKSRLAIAFLLLILAARGESRAQELVVASSLAVAGATPVAAPVVAPSPEPAAVNQAALTLPQQAPSDVHVALGKSVLITSQEPLQRVSVTDPNVASAVVVSPTQILIHGLKAGAGTLILWDDQDRARSFTLAVDLDINGLQESMHQVFPNETVTATQSGASLVLTGNVSSREVSDRAALLAGTISPSVVNLVTTSISREQIMLQVRFAEVDRTAIQQLGINILSTGGANTIGTSSTQQFNNIGNFDVGAVSGTHFNLTELLNIFLFRPDLNLAATIKALQQKNVLQILAEPNVMAINGSEASFLAGGEFPFPTIQSGASGNAVTIIFKEFGVRLNFKPTIMPDGTIHLKVSPEVSALDFTNALTVSGFVIPALSTRRSTTEVELRDGQSFAIAGLMDNRVTALASKIPGLGDIPILGKLFQSRSQTKSNTELLVMVTPVIVKPMAAGQAPPLPEYPKTFIEQGKFDGKKTEAPPAKKTARP